jgi:hypothetical protein
MRSRCGAASVRRRRTRRRRAWRRIRCASAIRVWPARPRAATAAAAADARHDMRCSAARRVRRLRHRLDWMWHSLLHAERRRRCACCACSAPPRARLVTRRAFTLRRTLQRGGAGARAAAAAASSRLQEPLALCARAFRMCLSLARGTDARWMEAGQPFITQRMHWRHHGHVVLEARHARARGGRVGTRDASPHVSRCWARARTPVRRSSDASSSGLVAAAASRSARARGGGMPLPASSARCAPRRGAASCTHVIIVVLCEAADAPRIIMGWRVAHAWSHACCVVVVW